MSRTIAYFFKTCATVNTFSGVLSPGPEMMDSGKLIGKLFFCVPVYVILLLSSQVYLCGRVISDYENMTNVYHTISIVAIYVYALFCVVYVLAYRQHFKRVFMESDSLLMRLESSSSSVERELTADYKYVRFWTIVNAASIIGMTTTNNFYKVLLNSVNGVKYFNYQVPYRTDSETIYYIAILSQALALKAACVCANCIGYYFITYFYIICKILIHLQNNIHSVFASRRSPQPSTCSRFFVDDYPRHNGSADNLETLKHWIQFDIQVRRVSREIIDLYSPILCVYFAYIYITVAFTIFSAIQNTHSHTFVEVMVLAYFTLLTLINFYMLCSYGNLIMVESEKVLDSVYSSCWYESTRTHKGLVRTVMQRAANPVLVNCYSSTSFDLTNSTFIVIIKSIVSFYLGLVQMRKET